MTSRIDHVLNNPAALLLEAGDVVLSADAVTLTSSGILTGIFTALVVTIGIRLRPRAVATRLGLALDIGMIALAQISSCLAAWMLILLVDSVHQGESDNIGFVQRFGLFMGPCIAVFYCGAIAIRTALTARYRKWRLEYDNEVPMEKTDSPV